VLKIQIFQDTTLCLWVNISPVYSATQHNISEDLIILAFNYSSLLIYNITLYDSTNSFPDVSRYGSAFIF
jgi:hypothetical protein